MASPYPYSTFPVQFFGGGIARSIFNPLNGNYNPFTGGSVFAGGTLQNNRLFDSNFGTLNYPYQGIHNAYNDNKPVVQNNRFWSGWGITKAVSAGTFATMVAGQYVILTFNSQLAGIASTVLRSPAAAGGDRVSQFPSIGWINTTRYNSGGGFYMFNGLPVNPLISRDNIKTETYPGTYSIPGRLTWNQTGAGSPKTQSYASRND